jgi:hypothetical protein
MPERPFEIVVHTDEDFQKCALERYSPETVGDLPFVSYREDTDTTDILHIPMWRWEVDQNDFKKYKVTFV